MFNLVFMFILGLLIGLINNQSIDYTVYRLVSDYFYTFRFCWNKTLKSLVKMIDNYLTFLINLVYFLTLYPNNLICCVTSIFLLYIVYLIIDSLQI